MTTIARQPIVPEAPTVTPQFAGEQRLLLYNVSWEAYEKIGEALADRPAIRLTYDQGNLEIMTTSPEHEWMKKRLGRCVEILTEECGLELETAGNATFKNQLAEKGMEPDDCFWIAHAAHMRARQGWPPDNDPPPDLFVEIEHSRTLVDRLPICASLRIPEVWRYNGKRIRVLLLQADRTYQEREQSPNFPGIDLQGIVPLLQPSETMDYLATMRAIQAWVREQLANKR